MRGGLEGEVLRLLRDAGPQTKAQLAEALGVPRTTLSGTIAALSAAGHVEDGTPAPSSGGRRSVTLRIASDRVVLAVSLGERRVRVAALDGHLSILAGVSIDLSDRGRGADPVPELVLGASRQVLDGRAPSGIGIATAGPDVHLQEEVSQRLSDAHPGTPLAALPAVRAMAVGERRSGAARGLDDFVAVRLGSGVTTATYAGGRLAGGASGRSGEVGHLRVEEFGPACTCGLTGCLDSFAGSGPLVAQATELAERGRSPALRRALDRSGALDLADLVAAGREGDAVVVQLARDLGQRLGRVVAALVAHANPRRVVVGGPVAALGAHLLGDLRATVYRVAPARSAEGLEVVLSELGEQAVLVGTGSGALNAWIGRLAL